MYFILGKFEMVRIIFVIIFWSVCTKAKEQETRKGKLVIIENKYKFCDLNELLIINNYYTKYKIFKNFALQNQVKNLIIVLKQISIKYWNDVVRKLPIQNNGACEFAWFPFQLLPTIKLELGV